MGKLPGTTAIDRIVNPRPYPNSLVPQKRGGISKYLHNLALRWGLVPRLPPDIQWVMDELERLEKEGIPLSSLYQRAEPVQLNSTSTSPFTTP